jgi:3-dehydrosphinganine reductase
MVLSTTTIALTITILIILAFLYFVHKISKRVAPVQWKGAHVVITGGSSGIGFCVAELAIKRGSNVTLIARNKEKLFQAQQQLEKLKTEQVRKFSTTQLL